LEIFNTLGQRVEELVNQVQEGRSYEAQWNAQRSKRNVLLPFDSSFTAAIRVKSFVQTRKMLLLK